MRRRLSSILLLVFGLSLAACRGGSGGPAPGGPGGVEKSLSAFSEAFATVTSALVVAFQQGTEVGAVTKYEHVRLCDPKGVSTVEESISDKTTDGTFLVEADLDECDGVGGEFDAVGSFARQTDGLLLNWSFEGTLKSGDCDVDLNDLSVTSSLEDPPAISVVTGTLRGTCVGETAPVTVTCTWTQAFLLSEEELLRGCSCTGSGC